MPQSAAPDFILQRPAAFPWNVRQFQAIPWNRGYLQTTRLRHQEFLHLREVESMYPPAVPLSWKAWRFPAIQPVNTHDPAQGTIRMFLIISCPMAAEFIPKGMWKSLSRSWRHPAIVRRWRLPVVLSPETKLFGEAVSIWRREHLRWMARRMQSEVFHRIPLPVKRSKMRLPIPPDREEAYMSRPEQKQRWLMSLCHRIPQNIKHPSIHLLIPTGAIWAGAAVRFITKAHSHWQIHLLRR